MPKNQKLKLTKSILSDFLRFIYRHKFTEESRILYHWKKSGRPAPPPQIFKQLVIKEYAKKYNLSIFIETGTYLGDTIDYCKNFFNKLISIELDAKLYENAQSKFAHENKISIYKGDSGEIIEKVLEDIDLPCLFWLDGHYSEGITAKGELNTPILQELNHILNHSIDKHVILIDDARCFIGKDDYPTLDYLRGFVNEQNSKLHFEVKNDIIRIYK